MKNSVNKRLNSHYPDNPAADKLIKAASAKLGCEPSKLKESLQNGQLEKQLRNGTADPSLAQAQKVLNDREAMKKLMSDPRIMDMVKKLKGGS